MKLFKFSPHTVVGMNFWPEFRTTVVIELSETLFMDSGNEFARIAYGKFLNYPSISKIFWI